MPIYGKHIFGRRITVAQQTVAELRYGAIAANWGERPLERLLRGSRVLSVDDQTTWACARPRHRCHAVGHPLHQTLLPRRPLDRRDGRRWQLPQVAHDDTVFLDCPDLQLLTELPQARP